MRTIIAVLAWLAVGALASSIAGPKARASASADADADASNDITVRARTLKVHDEVTYAPHSVAIEHPASDAYLGETLSKLPGMLVRSTSGFGSVTTVISAQALGSGGTGVSVDDIPILDNSGRGVNFSLFPSTLIGSVEHHSSFYPTLSKSGDPASDLLPAPGGRIDLRTLGVPRAGESRFVGSATLGTAHTLEATGGARGGDEKHEWVAGLTGYNTQGDYHYTDPASGGAASRLNNDAVGLGGLAKSRWNLAGGATVEAIDLVSESDRTNPGSLFSPARQHQKDFFNLLGAKYNAPRLLSDRDGVFAKAAYGHARTSTRGPDGMTGDAGQTTDQRANSYYGQAGYSRRDEQSCFTLAFDNQFDDVHQNEGIFTREVFGSTAVLAVELGRVRVVPLLREEASPGFPGATDGELSVIYGPDADDDLSLSYGATHSYPSITSVGGFTAGGLTVLPSQGLLVQRDNVVALNFDRRKRLYALYSSAFYDLIRNRSTFSFVSDSAAQFVNLSEVSAMGWILDGQLFPLEALALRLSGTVQRAWDRSTGHEMPYKPRVEGWAAMSWLLSAHLGVTLQEQYTGARFVSASGVATVGAFAQTIARFDAELGPGVAFFKVANLFDAGGFDYPGFPYTGRSFWLGYSVGGAAGAL